MLKSYAQLVYSNRQGKAHHGDSGIEQLVECWTRKRENPSSSPVKAGSRCEYEVLTVILALNK